MDLASGFKEVLWAENVRKIGNVNEGVVERGEDAGNAENELACMRLSESWSQSKIEEFDIPSPARGPRETFSLAAAGAFLVGAIATVGWSWRGWNTELKKEEEEMDEKKVDVCPPLQPDSDWLAGTSGQARC